MILLDWIRALIKRLSEQPTFITSPFRSRKRAGSETFASPPKRTRCPVIAPGLPRQRLDGLEIIVHCECEENDSTTISDEVSEESTCLKRESKVQPSCLESACQTSTCDFSMSTPCSKEPNMTTNGACPIADTTCNNPTSVAQIFTEILQFCKCRRTMCGFRSGSGNMDSYDFATKNALLLGSS
ncbi:uncharacterized protein LOC119651807 isoform X2 [Hermetia illucens]|uniref:uncharacterized protein LOC119651807 isoform X2 n=1 Tax=Hermetia illucens TaxID=343691 RepID=UPI0018CC0FC6|nr:uncharacterized protein LOC119651807 isoform X2 [Hermetia illucens]